MNRERRTKLGKAVSHLESASSIVEEVLFDEEDSFDNYPENLRENTERGIKMESSIEDMEEAPDCKDKLIYNVNNAGE